MKVNLVKDTAGKVVATFENPAADGPMMRPVLKAGHSIHEVEAEANYKSNIAAFYERHSR